MTLKMVQNDGSEVTLTMHQNPLPNMLPGWVCKQYVRRGSKLCGPYWYRLYREQGRLRKTYVRSSELEDTMAACARWREQMRLVTQHKSEARESGKDFCSGVEFIRSVEAMLARARSENHGA